MIKVAFLFLFLFFPLQGCYPQGEGKTQNGVQIPDQYTWDFGRIKEGVTLSHAFVLKNESNKILTIKNITTSCGCTASRAKKSVLAPGESTEIEVSLNSKGYSGDVKQYVYVDTDSIDKPIIRFIIKAFVIKQK